MKHSLLSAKTFGNRIDLSTERGKCEAGAMLQRTPSAETSGRPVFEKTFRTHDGVELFYRYWPTLSAKPRGAVLLFHRGHEHSGRMAHLADELGSPRLRDLRLGRARPRPLAGRARLLAEHRRVGARRAELRRPYRGRPRHRSRGHGDRGAKRRRGAGDDMGARLRAEAARHGARLARLQGEALRAVRAYRARS